MSQARTATYTADALEIEQTVKELRRLAELFPEVVNHLVNVSPSLFQLVSIDIDSTAASTASDVRILFKPSDFLLGCMTTLRAFERQGCVGK
jgi:hypothetical protein